MRKVDVAHRLGFTLNEDDIEKIMSFNDKRVSTKELANIFKKYKYYDYSIDLTIYAEKDIGEPPDTIIFSIEGGGR